MPFPMPSSGGPHGTQGSNLTASRRLYRAKLTERIRCDLANSEDPPCPSVQKNVLKQCRKWNLIWVGRNKVAPLEPDEVEFLLGFPKDHTRGISRTIDINP